MGVKISMDRSRVAARIKAGKMAMVAAVAEQAKADCNNYCKYDQGELRKSVETASDFQKGELVWNTPYAKAAYYTGKPSHEGTHLMWCEFAHDVHGQDWQKIAQKSFEKGMG